MLARLVRWKHGLASSLALRGGSPSAMLARLLRWKHGSMETCLAKKIPITPAFDMPKSLITKNDLKEVGIHFLKDVRPLHYLGTLISKN